MVLSSKKVEVKIKSDGDVFHELCSARPHEVPNLTPTSIQNCQILEGEVGTVGSVLLWSYFHEGKDCVFKVLVQELDKEKKSITMKALGGDILELCKSFVLHIHVDTDGLDNIVTWTIEYEKFNPNDPDPDSLLDFYKKITKDIEAHHLNN
ncbi:hypothetical protein L1887_36051 [Cichorium endivia]|nr:hypothetical protein L1887_36051 [Cichorium endivia]